MSSVSLTLSQTKYNSSVCRFYRLQINIPRLNCYTLWINYKSLFLFHRVYKFPLTNYLYFFIYRLDDPIDAAPNNPSHSSSSYATPPPCTGSSADNHHYLKWWSYSASAFWAFAGWITNGQKPSSIVHRSFVTVEFIASRCKRNGTHVREGTVRHSWL